MSINPSTSVAKALSKAAGESYVAYKLALHGWMAVNANAGVANMPNVDLIALKETKRVTVQIKSAKAKRSFPLAGVYRGDGKYFNAKNGPKADFVVSVRVPRDHTTEPVCYVFPVKTANRLAKEIGDTLFARPKRDGTVRSAAFPIWLRAEDTERVKPYCEAWRLLDKAKSARRKTL